VTVVCRVPGAVIVICADGVLLSDVDILARDAKASGKFGGVTGVLDGVRICTTYHICRFTQQLRTGGGSHLQRI